MDINGPEIRPCIDHQEFLAALAVRVAVFVTEQGGPPEDEPDSWDWAARHFVVVVPGHDPAPDRIVGTARIYQPGPRGVLKIGRVALLPEWRGRGWGTRLLRELLHYAQASGADEVRLNAQTAALPFYKRLGFVAVGEDFLDGGIPHRRMRLALTLPA